MDPFIALFKNKHQSQKTWLQFRYQTNKNSIQSKLLVIKYNSVCRNILKIQEKKYLRCEYMNSFFLLWGEEKIQGCPVSFTY